MTSVTALKIVVSYMLDYIKKGISFNDFYKMYLATDGTSLHGAMKELQLVPQDLKEIMYIKENL